MVEREIGARDHHRGRGDGRRGDRSRRRAVTPPQRDGSRQPADHQRCAVAGAPASMQQVETPAVDPTLGNVTQNDRSPPPAHPLHSGPSRCTRDRRRTLSPRTLAAVAFCSLIPCGDRTLVRRIPSARDSGGRRRSSASTRRLPCRPRSAVSSSRSFGHGAVQRDGLAAARVWSQPGPRSGVANERSRREGGGRVPWSVVVHPSFRAGSVRPTWCCATTARGPASGRRYGRGGPRR